MVLSEYAVYVDDGKARVHEKFVYHLDRFNKLFTIKDLTTDIKREVGLQKGVGTWKLFTSQGTEVKHLKDCSDGNMVLKCTGVAASLPSLSPRAKLSLNSSPRSTRSSTVKFPTISNSASGSSRRNSDTSPADNALSALSTSRISRTIRRKQLSNSKSQDAPKDHLSVPNSSSEAPKKTKLRSNSRSSTKSIKRQNGPVERQEGNVEKESLNEGVVRQSAAVKRIESDDQMYSNYDVGFRIGDGNFAKVYKATSTENKNDIFALKKIFTKRMKSKSYYIENEADLLYRCKHPNIIRMMAAFKTIDHYYLVLEYVENGDLFDAIKGSGPFIETVAAGISSDVAHALHYLHQFHIVHRDIKPENIFLTLEYRAKLGDFGLACKALGPLFRVCGTPTYVAPEVLNESGYGIEVDLWSLGIILYIMLCGYAPFRNQDREKLFKLIQNSKFDFEGSKWITVSDAAKQLIEKLLVQNVSKRLTASQVLKDRWIRSMIQNEL